VKDVKMRTKIAHVSAYLRITQNPKNGGIFSKPTRKTRKFDVHACEAGMNIKFPALLGRWHVPHHTS
jgi:hypothetical protein